MVDILIRNGQLFDPGKNISRVGDLAILDGKILPWGVPVDKARDSIDASGCLVVPGLIDTHVHVYDSGSELGVSADPALLPMGVTSAIDLGSAGYVNFKDYLHNCVMRGTARIFSFINVSPTGPISIRISENVNPRGFDKRAYQCLLDEYKEKILGLKIRMGKETIGSLGIQPLKDTIHIAEELGCRVAVHVSNSTVSIRQIAEMLRPNDVFCHVYQDRGETILDEKGHIWPEIQDARKRGVLFDVAHGMKNASNAVARAAIENGFFPDFIGTDLSSFVAYCFICPYMVSL